MSLQVWLPLTGHLNNQGLSDVTVTNSGATVDNNGKIGKCYSFNGTSSKLYCTLPTAVSSSVGSLACWVKFNALPQSASSSGARWYSLIQLGALGGFATCRLGLYMEYSDKINISVDGSATNGNAYVHSLAVNTWYHLCTTYDGNIVKIYVNGAEVMSKAVTKGTYTSAASYLYIGGTSGYWLDGYMNDIRYYDHALSTKEVKELSKGLVLHYPLSAGFGGAENLFRDSAMGQHAIDNMVDPFSTDWTKYFRYYNGTTDNHSFSDGIDTITLNGTGNIGICFCRKATDIALDSSSYYTISCEAKCEISGAHLDIGLSYYNTSNAWVWRGGTNPQNFIAVDTWQKFTLTFKPDADTQYIMYCFTIKNTAGKHFSIKHCKLEKGSVATPWTMNSGDVELVDIATTEYDVSGYNNHGTKAGTITYTSDSVRYSVTSHFINGSYIMANKNSPDYLPKDSITVNLWIRCTTWGNPISCTEGGGFNFETSNSGVGFVVYLNGVGYKNAYGISGSSLLDGKWHMLTGVYDRINQTVNTYLDAQLMKTTATGSSAVIGYASNRLIISGEAQSTTPASSTFVGEESDVRIYATALSAEDVKQLYNTAASLSNNGTLFAYEYVET